MGKVVASRDYRWRWVARFVAWSFQGESVALGVRLRTEVTEVTPE
jgi:hypothetical protein